MTLHLKSIKKISLYKNKLRIMTLQYTTYLKRMFFNQINVFKCNLFLPIHKWMMYLVINIIEEN